MTYANAQSTLSRLAKSKTPGAQRAMCGCHGQPRFHAVPEVAQEIEVLAWSVCPFDLIDNPFDRQVTALKGLLDRGLQPRGELVAWAAIGLLGR